MDIPSKKADTNNSSSNTSRITMKIHKCCTISINKPLIPLKLALFCYYGAGSFMPSFITLLFKQRGVTLSELSTMTVFAPIVQVLGSTVSGVVTDKLGRSKPALVANMLFTTSCVIGILLLPKIDLKSPDPFLIANSCNPRDIDPLFLQTTCESMLKERNCSILCTGNNETKSYEDGRNMSFITPMNNEYYWNRTEDKCFYRVDPVHYKGINLSLCDDASEISCAVVCCSTNSHLKCSDGHSSGNTYLIAYAVLYILFLTGYSNTYRSFDITVMSLVKKYDSNFGHERFFSILGNMAISPIAGIISQAQTPDGGDKNYASALYFFICIICVLLFIVYYIPVVITTPGDKMWKKSFELLNVDVLIFSITILTLGTCFNFVKYFTFWYLEGLNAPSILIGLIPSVSALYGLPFLITANWWVKKLGTHKIFILALLAYVGCFVGYSFLKDPWISLLLELHGCFSYYLLWVAVIEHSHYTAPEGLTSTAISISGAIHYSAGKSTSGLLGGMVMHEFGAVVAFRLLAIICLSVAVLYTCYRFLRNRCGLKKDLENKKDIVRNYPSTLRDSTVDELLQEFDDNSDVDASGSYLPCLNKGLTGSSSK